MHDFLMNPWIVTIIGGVVVGVLVFLISRLIVGRGSVSPLSVKDTSVRQHQISVGKKGCVQSGGTVQAGDRCVMRREPGSDRRHEIKLGDEGTIVAEGDVVAGDTQDSGSVE